MSEKITPKLITSEWFNTDSPLSIQALKGKVVVVHAFQMLCPGCVSHGIPQASVVNDAFSKDQVQVIGLHSVFEHHQVMTPDALRVFLHEYKVTFPVAVDQPSLDKVLPKTMDSWQLQGTPSLIVFDKFGQCRLKHFGRLSDLQVGTIVGKLAAEENNPVLADDTATTSIKSSHSTPNCNDDACSI